MREIYANRALHKSKETYKRNLQKNPTKKTYKRDLEKRPTKETYKKALQKRPTKQAYRPSRQILADLRAVMYEKQTHECRVKRDLFIKNKTTKRDLLPRNFRNNPDCSWLVPESRDVREEDTRALCQKRPVYMKKETYIYEKRPRKEIYLLRTSTTTQLSRHFTTLQYLLVEKLGSVGGSE